MAGGDTANCVTSASQTGTGSRPRTSSAGVPVSRSLGFDWQQHGKTCNQWQPDRRWITSMYDSPLGYLRFGGGDTARTLIRQPDGGCITRMCTSLCCSTSRHSGSSLSCAGRNRALFLEPACLPAPVAQLVALAGGVLVGVLLRDLVICPAVEDARVDLVQRLNRQPSS